MNISDWISNIVWGDWDIYTLNSILKNLKNADWNYFPQKWELKFILDNLNLLDNNQQKLVLSYVLSEKQFNPTPPSITDQLMQKIFAAQLDELRREDKSL